jgi:gentisate 1,2-dioxygenase
MSNTAIVTETHTSEPKTKKLKLGNFEVGDLEDDVRMYEYTSAANPNMSQIPVLALPASEHESGPTRVIPFDMSEHINVSYPATSPNLLASFIRINPGDSLETQASATSQAFYIIRGVGSSISEHGEMTWSQGDLFVLPATEGAVNHTAAEDTAIYWITDEPLLQYLGAKPSVRKFKPTLFRKERMLAEVERIKHQPGAEHRNRMGILLGNKVTEDGTKTLTHTLWSLLNVLPAGDAQRPHRHNSVALDLCVSAEPSGVYTLMGPELNEDGWVKDPIRCDWKTGAVFVTPPGWWHSHHNETAVPAWVLPMQDAGLYTHMRTLDIRFASGPTSSSSSSQEKK